MARRRTRHSKAQPPPPGRRRSQWPLIAGGALIVLIIILYSMSSKEPIQPHAAGSSSSPATFSFTKDGELTFTNPDGTAITTIDIEIAASADERTVGLMYRDTLAMSQGMLFIFPIEEIQSFWMKNTSIPLDMLYVNARNEIVTIHQNTVPFTTESYSSRVPVLFVVEVPAGFVSRHGLQTGDKIRWERTAP